MNDYYDTQEIRAPALRERELMARLPAQIAHAKAKAPGFADLLRDIDPARIASRAALSELPVLRKNELIERQKSERPFGGLATASWGNLGRVYSSPGPIYEPEGRSKDYWRTARSLFAAGMRSGDLIHNSFSYHMTPGGWMLDAGAQALGCSVFPGGVGQTEQQVQAMVDLRPNAYVGTPSFLCILLEKADELGLAIPSLTRALVSGEAFLPPVRAALFARGIEGYQAYVTADLGLIAYETPAHEGLVVDEDVILEIVRPGTGDPVPEGEVGEVLVTLFNADYPLVRFATGDLSAFLPGASACGRTNQRIRGWLGRADQTTKIKGMFVHPEQIAAVLKRHPEIQRARLVVTNPESRDAMTLHCETASQDEQRQAIADSLRELTKLRGEILFLVPGSLPNDGKVIDDQRNYN